MFGEQDMCHKLSLRNVNSWFIQIAILSLPSIAFAYGNPLIVVGLGGVAFMHLIFAIYLLFRRIEWGKKAGIVIVYTIAVLLTWEWGLDYRGPDFKIAYTVLILIPLIAFLVLVFIAKRICKATESN